jgi:hypothetical protein
LDGYNLGFGFKYCSGSKFKLGSANEDACTASAGCKMYFSAYSDKASIDAQSGNQPLSAAVMQS